MTLLKDETTTRLDDVTRAGEAALALYEDLHARIADASLGDAVARHVAGQRSLLEELEDYRRSRGDLPQAADPERSHVEAAGAFLRAAMLPGDSTKHYAESLLDTAVKVGTEIDEALRADVDAGLRRLLARMRDANEAFQRQLRTFV